jgi:hypothetical protein
LSNSYKDLTVNRKFTILFAIAIGLLLSEYNQLLISQPQQEIFKPEIKIGGQIRYRGELDLRYFDLNAKPLFINLLRTRLNADVIISPNVRAFVQLQDSRNFGEENGRAWRGTLDGSGDNLDLHQGWIELSGLGLENLNVRLGRMMFATNSERIIGNLDWHNVGRSYDGAWASYKYNDWSVRGFAFLLGSQELLMTSAAAQTPKMVGGIELNLPYIPSGNVYLYHDLNERAISGLAGPGSSSPALSRYTAGAFTKNETEGLVWELEAAMQFGNIDTIPRLRNNNKADINAWLVSVYGGYKVDDFTIGGGIDAYSGDNPETDAYEGFDHIFFTLHKFYGYMDFFPFTVLPGGGLRSGIEGSSNGLLMPNIKLAWKADSRWKFDAHFMTFQTVEPFKFGNEDLNSLGSEIDLLATCNIAKGVTAQFGSSIFLPGKILEKTNPALGMGTDISYWGYTMLTVDF